MSEKVISLIENEAGQRGIAPSTLCLRAVNDGKLFKRLVQGGSINLRTLEKLESYFQETAK
jgi:hypothetical protein